MRKSPNTPNGLFKKKTKGNIEALTAKIYTNHEKHQLPWPMAGPLREKGGRGSSHPSKAPPRRGFHVGAVLLSSHVGAGSVPRLRPWPQALNLAWGVRIDESSAVGVGGDKRSLSHMRAAHLSKGAFSVHWPIVIQIPPYHKPRGCAGVCASVAPLPFGFRPGWVCGICRSFVITNT